MAKYELIEPGSFSLKLLTFYLVLLADVGTNCYTYYSEFTSDSNGDSFGDSNSMLISLIILGVQGALQVIIICWIFLLVWRTFLFKYGLIGILCSEFKVIFINIPIHLILFGAEKALRFYLESSISEGAIDLWTHAEYQIVYWIRSIYMIYFYLILVSFSLEIGDPVYYKADKWLDLNR